MAEDKTNDKDWAKIAKEAELAEQAEQEQNAENVAQPIEKEQDEMLDFSALEHPSYKALEAKLTATEQKVHENWDIATRAQAELENVRRRAVRDVENAHKFATEKFIKGLLPVIDSLEQALQIEIDEADESGKQMRQGIELTLKLFLGELEKASIVQLNPENAPFDPEFHEAISMQEDKKLKPGTILVVFQKGYLLHNRPIRPARVIVSK